MVKINILLKKETQQDLCFFNSVAGKTSFKQQQQTGCKTHIYKIQKYFHCKKKQQQLSQHGARMTEVPLLKVVLVELP